MEHSQLIYFVFTFFLLCNSVQTVFGEDCWNKEISGMRMKGITYYPLIDRLLIVGEDNSFLYELSSSGHQLKKRHFKYANGFNKDQEFDFEGITVSVTQNVTNKLYIVNEHPYRIFEAEYNFTECNDTTCQESVTVTMTRTFDISHYVEKARTDKGLSSITFVDDAEGGLFYVGHQYLGLVYIFRLPIQEPATNISVYYVDTMDVDGPSSDLIGLTSYSDPENRTVLYALYDSNEKMIANDRNSGKDIYSWRVNGYAYEQNDLVLLSDLSEDNQTYVFILEEDTLWKYPFPIDEAYTDSMIMMDCYRPTNPVVIMYILIGSLYTVVGVVPLVQFIRLIKHEHRLRTKALINFLMLLTCTARAIFALYNGLNASVKEVGLALYIFLLLFPFCFVYATYTLLVFIWAELISFHRTTMDLIPAKMRLWYLAANGLLVVLVGIQSGVLYSVRDEELTTSIHVIVGFGVIIAILVFGAAVGLIYYGASLFKILRHSQDQSRDMRQIIEMSGIAIVCGACLLGGLFLVAGFYVLDGRGGELVSGPLLLVTELIPIILLLFLQRRGENEQNRPQYNPNSSNQYRTASSQNSPTEGRSSSDYEMAKKKARDTFDVQDKVVDIVPVE